MKFYRYFFLIFILFFLSNNSVKAITPPFLKTCNDTDGGKVGQEYTYGVVTLEGFGRYDGNYPDRCKTNQILHEYSCVKDKDGKVLGARFDPIDCGKNKCKAGACIRDRIPCKDSDGGKNYPVKGVVTVREGIKMTDNCRPNSKTLYEYYCKDSDNYDVDPHECKNGCRDGACLSNPTLWQFITGQSTAIIEGVLKFFRK